MKAASFLFFLLVFCIGQTAFAQASKDTLTVIGVGDIMLGTVYPLKNLAPGDGRYILRPVHSILKNADITFGNYEGTLFDSTGMPKKCKDSLNCFAFKTPERYAAYLKESGFDLLNIANNHSGDFGLEGRKRTLQVLANAGIAAAGTTSTPYCILNKGGVRYGLACFAPNTGTPSINGLAAAKKTVALLDSLCDVVIVSFHGGAEGLKYQSVTRQREIFLGEDRGNVYEFAHAVIDAGADIVFGHGPHVTRAVDLYKDRFIIYSLGNFATYGRFNLKGEAGIAPIVKVYTDSRGRFLKAEVIPVKQLAGGGPLVDKKRTVIKKLQYLTAKDFPESDLAISNRGVITRKPAYAVK